MKPKANNRFCIIFLFAALWSLGATHAHAALSLAVTVNPNPAQSGEMVSVAYTLVNTGLATESNVTLEAVLPTGVNAIHPESLISHGGDCPGVTCANGDTIRWHIGTLAAGEGLTVTLPAIVATGIYTPVDGTVVPFTASIVQNASPVVSAAASLIVESEPRLALVLTANANPVARADWLTYHLSFGNRSAAVLAQSAVLFLPIPTGASVVSADANALISNGVVSWNLGELAPGEWGRRQLQLQLATTGLVQAQATISAATNESLSALAVRVASPPPLALSINANPLPLRPGQTLLVSYSVSNLSDRPRDEVVLRARVPDGLLSINPASLLSHGGECSDDSCEPGELIVWRLPRLAADETVTVTAPFVAKALPNGSIIPFTAFVEEGRVRAGLSVPIAAEPVFELVLSPAAEPIASSDLLSYRLSFANRSAAVLAPDTVLTLPIPQGTAFVSASDNGQESEAVVRWLMGDLGPGEWGQRRLDLQVLAGDFIQAQATISDGTNEASASAVVRIKAPEPLALSITASAYPPRSGEMLNLFYSVANVSDSVRRGVILRARVPDALQSINPESLISHGGDCTGGTCDPREFIVWSLGDLAVGEAVTVTVPFVPSSDGDTAPDGTIMPFSARVVDETGVDVSAHLSVALESKAILELALMADADPVKPGDLLTYTLNFGNRSTAVLAQGAVLSMALPAGTTFVWANGNGVESDGVVRWDLADWRPGQGSERVLQVRLDALPSGHLINAEAWLKDAATPANERRASLTTRLHSDAPLSLSLSASVSSAQSGDVFDIKLKLSNTSVAARNNVVVLARVPEGIGSVFESSLGGGRCRQIECNARDYIRWDVAALDAGQSITLNFPAVIATGADAPANGTVISFNAKAFDASDGHAYAMDRVLVGNASPVANADTAAMDENALLIRIDVLSNDSDVDGDSLSLAGVEANTAQGGQVRINAGRLAYTPAYNFNGKDQFFYTVSDGNGGLDQGEVTVTVKAKPRSDGGGGVMVYLLMLLVFFSRKNSVPWQAK